MHPIRINAWKMVLLIVPIVCYIEFVCCACITHVFASLQSQGQLSLLAHYDEAGPQPSAPVQGCSQRLLKGLYRITRSLIFKPFSLRRYQRLPDEGNNNNSNNYWKYNYSKPSLPKYEHSVTENRYVSRFPQNTVTMQKDHTWSVDWYMSKQNALFKLTGQIYRCSRTS